MKQTILNAPARACGSDNNAYRFVLNVQENKSKSTLDIERNFKKLGNWDRVPSGWYIGTLLGLKGYHGTGQTSDQIFIDAGQDWYVTGLIDAIEECKQILGL